ncbi:MAG: PTS sugar transporter subunit IIA [Planctomycetota bacterium]
MKLCDIVHREAIVPRLQSGERDEVVRELVGALVDAGLAEEGQRDALVSAVIERETKGSTGFGKGVAVPHVKSEQVTSMVAALGVSEGGVEFNALDKQPVYTVFLLLSPSGKPEDHLRAMEIIFKNLSQDWFRRFLRQATTVEEVWQVLEDADAQQGA